ncbi:PAS domain S-box protein [Anabaena subtropica]|uniref:histidine kinase n=1 Tax=Anabaena subtropica FACHB-260 TaxID=2692884 RepID=A0ABR8CJN7_9NOST|nr:PAS domain S-box protein [Anabaena subtropica]MBD2343069.1 PAS domain S-box protein [Anabaena subtropica FACHB-260]
MQSLPHLLWPQCLESMIDFSPLTVEPEKPLSDVVSQMAKQDAGIVVIVNSQLLGWLSERDVVKLVALGVDFQTTKISEVMNTSVIAFKLSQFEDITAIISMLRKHPSSCLLVIDEKEQLMGTVTSESVYQALQPATDLNHQEELQIPQEHLRLLESTLVNANDTILTSEKSLSHIADDASILIWMSGTDASCNFFNKLWLEFTGNSLEQEIGKGWAECVHPEDLQSFLDNYLSAFHARQCFSMEYRLRGVDGQYCWLLNIGVPKFTSNGNFAGYISFCIDITEHKHSFAAIEEMTNRLKLALESTDTIYWERNLSNDQLFFLNAVDGLGVARELTHSEVLTFFHPDDVEKVEMAAQEAIANCSCLEVEHRLPIPGQPFEYKWLLSRGTVITDTTGNPTRMIGVSMDITERVQAQVALQQANQELEMRVAERTLALEEANKQLLLEIGDRQIAQEQLRQSQQMLQLVMDTIPQCIFWKDRNSVFLGCNRHFAKMLGLEHPENIIGKTDYDFLTNHQDADLYRECDARVIETNIPEYHIIEPLHKADGQKVWLETNKVPLHDVEGNVVGILGTFEEITERKQAQEALEKSEERFRFLAESIPQQVWIAQPDGYIEYVNQRTLEYFDCTPEAILGWQWHQWIHEDDRHRCLEAWSHCVATGEPLDIEFRWFRAMDQTYRWHLGRALALCDDAGNIINWFGTNTDIDDRKRTEEVLAEKVKLANFRAEVDTILTQSYTLQDLMRGCTDAVVQHLNAAFARIWILNKAENLLELQVSSGMYTHIDGPHRCVPVGQFKIGLIAQQGTPHFTNSVTTDPHISHPEWATQEGMIAFAGYPLIVEGEILGVLAMFSRQALSESTFQSLGIAAHEIAIGIKRQQTEEALRHSEERFRNLVEASSDWVWEVDENAIYTYVSPKVREILGYEPQEILGRTPFEIMPPAEAERVMNIFTPIIEAQQPFKCLENTNVHKDGRLVVLETSGMPVFNTVGKFCGYRGMDRDITTRKQVETNLYQTQQQLQAILDNSPAMIYVMDIQGRFMLVNRRYEELFNTDQAEIIGKSLYDTWPHDIANGFAVNNRRVIADGIAIEVEEVVPQEDSLHTYFSIKFPLKDHHGTIYGICGISTDITERKLAEDSLLRFHKAMESTSDAIIFSDIFDIPIYTNPAFQELYGHTLEELQVFGGVGTIFHEPQERQNILTSVMKGESWRGEVTMRSRSGRPLQIYLRSDAIKDSNGKITGIVCIHTDITQRKQVEEGLKLRDRAIDASSNGIIIADASTPSGPIIYVNPAFERMTGYSSDEVIGQNFRLFQSADIDQPGLRKLSAAMQAGKACTVVLRNYRKNGSLLWNELNISPVYDNGGQLTHYISIQTDITERKQAETALLVSQQRLQYLLTSSPGVIYTCKTFGNFDTIFISDNITTMTGYEAHEFTENSGFWSSHIHPEDASFVLNKLSHVLEQGSYKLEYRFLHKDGTYHWLYDQGLVVQDDTANPVEIVGYLIDITDRKQLEEYLKVALEKEKELSELKSRFVSMTSHEFRTPLSTILSSSELLEHYRHKWTEEKQLTHLHRIQVAVKRMTEMLDDILIIGKAEAGKLELVTTSFDVVTYCRNLIEEIQLNLSNQQVYFTSEHESMPCCMDEKLLGHILTNLISNAIKYSPSKSDVRVVFYCRDGRAVFEIHDWGIGISPEDITHLFESFYRAKNVGNILGTGLGLAIVKKCVDIHQGEISVSSKIGIGTVFTVNLPLNHQI